MALKSSALTEANTYEVEVSVDGETFMSAVNKIYKKEVKRIAVPGFRKGKAPRAIIEKMYGKDVFYEDAMQECYPDALDAACKEADLKVVTVTGLEALDAGADGFTFKATVIVEPEIDIKDYKGIEVEKLSTEVTEELIDEEIERKIADQVEKGQKTLTVKVSPILGAYLTRGWNSFVRKWRRKYKCKLDLVEVTEHSILQYEITDLNGKALE